MRFVLTGPTGSGKTALALRVAPRLNAEIISMDAMALYRGLDVGTAKPTPEEREAVRHHLVDALHPWESASVARWLAQAELAATDIEARGKVAVYVGGTPLYLKALIAGLFDGPPADLALRARLEAEAQAHGSLALHQRLAQLDPAAGRRLHPNDLRRIVRALEVIELTGKPMSQWQTQWSQTPVAGYEMAWLDLPRDELYARIDRRVEAMFAAGLVDEVRRLCADPRGLSREARQGIGYKEVIEHLEGTLDLPAALEKVQRRSRNLAKRQITWFRHLPGCKAVPKELTELLWESTMVR